MSTIPIMPLPPTIEEWISSEVRPHIDSDVTTLLQLSHEEIAELEWTTPLDTVQLVEESYEQGRLPHNYEYYYWYLDIPLINDGNFFDSGMYSNYIHNFSGSDQLNPAKVLFKTHNDTCTVRMFFIYHPVNETEENPNWYIAFSKDDQPGLLEINLESDNNHNPQVDYCYSIKREGVLSRFCDLALLNWTGCYNGVLTPTSLTLYGTNKLPIK